MTRESKTCLNCETEEIKPFLSLGPSAPANAYLTTPEPPEGEAIFPLSVAYCKNCHTVQLIEKIDREAIFRHYPYFSSASPQLVAHFKDYADEIIAAFPNQSRRLVVEIGSNDGIFLKNFKAAGARVLGIDPARNVAAAANREGIETIPEFFGTRLVPLIISKYGKAGVVAANNVLAHTDAPHDLLEGAKQILAPDGALVIQVKYLGDLLQKIEFDTIYHEHIFYFSLLSLQKLLQKHDLEIFNLKRVETEGGSLRVFVSHASSSLPKSGAVERLLQEEYQRGLQCEETYLEFAQKPPRLKQKLIQILTELKAQNKKISGYGASAKGNVLLQYCQIGPQIIDCIADDSPHKQGKYTPGMRIPIVSADYLRKHQPDYILLLAWNFADSIMERHRWFKNRGGKWIIPIPEPRIV